MNKYPDVEIKTHISEINYINYDIQVELEIAGIYINEKMLLKEWNGEYTFPYEVFEDRYEYILRHISWGIII